MKMYSGGAFGSDYLWSLYALKSNISVKIISFGGHNPKIPIHKGDLRIKVLDSSTLKKANFHLNKANKTLNRYFPSTSRFTNLLLQRNYFIIKEIPTIIAIGSLNKNIVKGGTGWAVQMGIDNNKEVYVFDQNFNNWYKYDYSLSKFTISDLPIINADFAGIGSRQINEKLIKQTLNKFFSNISN